MFQQQLLPLVDALASSLSFLRDAIANEDDAALYDFLRAARASRRTLIGEGTPSDP